MDETPASSDGMPSTLSTSPTLSGRRDEMGDGAKSLLGCVSNTLYSSDHRLGLSRTLSMTAPWSPMKEDLGADGKQTQMTIYCASSKGDQTAFNSGMVPL